MILDAAMGSPRRSPKGSDFRFGEGRCWGPCTDRCCHVTKSLHITAGPHSNSWQCEILPICLLLLLLFHCRSNRCRGSRADCCCNVIKSLHVIMGLHSNDREHKILHIHLMLDASPLHNLFSGFVVSNPTSSSQQSNKSKSWKNASWTAPCVGACRSW